MKYNLESFNDLGKCTFSPKHVFDTDTDRIFECTFDEVNKEIIKEEIKIDSLETLFKYLWASPWAATGTKNYGTDYFYGKDPKPWWELPREQSWKKFCEERLDAVKEAIRRDNENLGI